MFLSMSKALIDFSARHIPRSTVRTLRRIRRSNVGVVVTAKETFASLRRLRRVPCSTIVTLGKSSYMLESNAPVSHGRVPRGSFRVMLMLTRRCKFTLTVRAGGNVFIGRLGPAIVRLTELIGRPAPPITSVRGRFVKNRYYRLYVCYSRRVRGRMVTRLPKLSISE